MMKDYRFCPKCGQDLREASKDRVCRCGHHDRLSTQERLSHLFDDAWQVHGEHFQPQDPLGFTDRISYPERLRQAAEQSQASEAIVIAEGHLSGHRVIAGVFVFEFIGGSMGKVVGDRVLHAVELALSKRAPVVFLIASGGARMQEGAWSLVQMARISHAMGRLRAQGVLSITGLVHPTTGGVAASLAMLGDWIFAEPQAYIAFTGARVLGLGQDRQQTYAEDLQHFGHVDAVLSRAQQHEYLRKRVALWYAAQQAEEGFDRES